MGLIKVLEVIHLQILLDALGGHMPTEAYDQPVVIS